MSHPLQPDDPSTEIPAQMVMELAANIQSPAEVLDRYGVDHEVFKEVIARQPRFVAAFKEAKQFWHSDANAKERIQVKAAAMLEDSLLELHRLFHDAAKNPTARLEALKSMMKLARMDAGEARVEGGAAVGRSVHVHINLGAAGGGTIDREIKDITPGVADHVAGADL